MDKRMPLLQNNTLVLNGLEYRIDSLIGFGASTFVYSATHRDNLMSEEIHSVLIKELFPHHRGGLITRGADGSIERTGDGLQIFEAHKRSYLRGNAVHLNFAKTRADKASVNINSYEANGTVYTVIGNSNGETLKTVAGRGEIVKSLSEVVMYMIKILEALDVFHQQGLLHLDISPDNILLLPPESGSFGRRVMLIDYNSMWSMNDIRDNRVYSFNEKESYSAPEVRMQIHQEVCPASDLFSVCAMFYEYLRGEPLVFSSLYCGKKVTGEELPLLNNVSPAVMTLVMKILRKGLMLAPNLRYQSVLDLKLVFVELLQELTRVKQRTLFIRISGVVCAAALTAAAFILAGYFTASYPNSEKELNAAVTVMTALTESLGRLGWAMDSDLKLLDNGGIPATAYSPPPRNISWNADELIKELGTRSPIPETLLRDLMSAPDTYADWSADMWENVLRVTDADSIYPEDDWEEIIGLYEDYLDSYSGLCFTKLQLTVLQLNEDGKKPLFDALPYIPVFGDMFLTNTFGTDKQELTSALGTESVQLQEIINELKGYGI